MRKFVLGLAAAFCVAATPASAAYIVDITQIGNDVVVTGSGSINLAGLAHPGTGNVTGNLGPKHGRLAVGSGRNNAYSGILTGPREFGTGAYLTPDIVTGLPVGFNVQNAVTTARFILVPFGYQSGTDLLTSTAIYQNRTFEDFGLTAGSSYQWTWGAGAEQDSFTVNVKAGVVPEPATWAMMIAGFGLTGAAMRRRSALKARLA